MIRVYGGLILLVVLGVLVNYLICLILFKVYLYVCHLLNIGHSNFAFCIFLFLVFLLTYLYKIFKKRKTS